MAAERATGGSSSTSAPGREGFGVAGARERESEAMGLGMCHVVFTATSSRRGDGNVPPLPEDA